MYIIIYPRFARSFILVIAVTLLPIIMFIALTGYALGEMGTEAGYRDRHGMDWKTHYEEEHEPLTKSRVRAVVAIHGGVAIACIGGWVIRQITTALGAQSTSSRRRRSR